MEIIKIIFKFLQEKSDYNYKMRDESLYIERRRYPRLPFGLKVTSLSGSLIGFTKNISKGGLFIYTDWILPVGRHVDIKFDIPYELEPIKSKCEIIHYGKNKEGIGVKFIYLSEKDLSTTDQFINDFLKLSEFKGY